MEEREGKKQKREGWTIKEKERKIKNEEKNNSHKIGKAKNWARSHHIRHYYVVGSTWYPNPLINLETIWGPKPNNLSNQISSFLGLCKSNISIEYGTFIKNQIEIDEIPFHMSMFCSYHYYTSKQDLLLKYKLFQEGVI